MINEQEIAKQIILEKCKDDLIFLGKTVAKNAFDLKSPVFHTEMASLLIDRSKKQIVIQAPRGVAKSTLAIFTILHHIIFDKGNKVIILQSKTQDEAKDRLDTLQKILNHSKEFKALFGNIGKYSGKAKTWGKYEIETSLNGQSIYIKSIGGGMSARGKMFSGEDLDFTRITLYYGDDIEDETNTKTPEATQRNLSKFLGDIGGMDLRTGRTIAVGTPIIEGCVVEKLQESAGWDSLHYEVWWKKCKCGYKADPLKSICDKCGEETTNIPTEFLWEDKYDENWINNKIEELKSQGTLYKFYTEYMCRVVGSEDQLFKREYLNEYKGWLETKKVGHDYENYLHITSEQDEDLKEEKILPVNTFIGVDPASSTAQRADFTVVFPVALDNDENIYCLPYLRKRLAPAEVAEGIIDKIKLTRPRRGGIETNGYQEMLREIVRKMMASNNCFVPGFDKGEGFNPRTEKNKRLERLHGYFYKRNVWIIKSEHQAFIDELLAYPRGSHDDTLDAFDYATRRMYEPDHQIQKEEEEDNMMWYPTLGGVPKDEWMTV